MNATIHSGIRIGIGIATGWAATLALLAVVAPTRGAGAEEAADPIDKYFWVDTATVVAVEAGEDTLRVRDTLGQATYRVDEATLIRRGGDTIALDALDAGDRVAISAHQGLETDDAPVADTITVVIVDPDSGEPVRRSP